MGSKEPTTHMTSTTQRPKRRCFRYSLRTLLFIFTALCIWLGLHVEAARKQREAVAAILAVDGGEVWYDFQQPAYPLGEKPEPHFAAKLFGLDLFYNVTGVSVSDDSARLILHIVKLPSLRKLVIYRCSLRDEDIEHLADLKQLEYLELYGNQIAGPGLTFLEGLRNLHYLSICSNPIVDDNLGFLQHVTHLKRLNLSSTELTDASVQQLAKLPQSVELDICRTNITSDGALRLLELRPDRVNVDPHFSLLWSLRDPRIGPFRSHLCRNNPIHGRKVFFRFIKRHY